MTQSCDSPHEFEVVGGHVHTYNPSTQKMRPGLPHDSGQRGLHNEFQVSLAYRVRACLKIKRGRDEGREKGIAFVFIFDWRLFVKHYPLVIRTFPLKSGSGLHCLGLGYEFAKFIVAELKAAPRLLVGLQRQPLSTEFLFCTPRQEDLLWKL